MARTPRAGPSRNEPGGQDGAWDHSAGADRRAAGLQRVPGAPQDGHGRRHRPDVDGRHHRHRPRPARPVGLPDAELAAPAELVPADRHLEPDRLAVRGGPGTPPGGELVNQVQPAAALVGLRRAADPGQPHVVVEDLHPHRVAAAAQPQAERLGGRTRSVLAQPGRRPASHQPGRRLARRHRPLPERASAAARARRPCAAPRSSLLRTPAGRSGPPARAPCPRTGTSPRPAAGPPTP